MSIVWVYVSNLRKKIAQLGAGVEIRATRGVGYSLEARHDPAAAEKVRALVHGAWWWR